MTLKINIADSASNITADVISKDTCECKALAVATIPYNEYINSSKFFFNDENGVDMNQDASTGGTPLPIHDGIDIVLWTASDIVGGDKTTFNSTDRSHSGSNSVKVDKSPVGDIFQFLSSVNVNMVGYVTLTMWINVDKDWKAGDSVEIYGFDTVAGLIIGDLVDLSNYFSYDVYDVWQKISIPLSDFGDLSEYTSLDAFRVSQSTAEGKSPKYYLDDIQLEESGTPIKYTIKADLGTWLYVDSFTISIVNNVVSTLPDATMPNISYNSFLGETLSSGLNYKREINGETIFSTNVKTLMDFLQQPNTIITGSGYDGTNTWVTLQVKNAAPLVLKSRDEDELSFTISEDLSGLLHLRISAACRLENRD